jgi:hypothetical protein
MTDSVDGIDRRLSQSEQITELDGVEFIAPIGAWPAGTRAVVLERIGDGALVEIAGTHGRTLALLCVPWSALRRDPKETR